MPGAQLRRALEIPGLFSGSWLGKYLEGETQIEIGLGLGYDIRKTITAIKYLAVFQDGTGFIINAP